LTDARQARSISLRFASLRFATDRGGGGIAVAAILMRFWSGYALPPPHQNRNAPHPE
jgi:hypothetical protein